jgi:hypothetical protein
MRGCAGGSKARTKSRLMPTINHDSRLNWRDSGVCFNVFGFTRTFPMLNNILIIGAIGTAGVICFFSLFFHYMRDWNGRP